MKVIPRERTARDGIVAMPAPAHARRGDPVDDAMWTMLAAWALRQGARLVLEAESMRGRRRVAARRLGWLHVLLGLALLAAALASPDG